jgi:hypothetical protein
MKHANQRAEIARLTAARERIKIECGKSHFARSHAS